MPDPAHPTARTAGPNCLECRHFAVSWDPRFPYSCRLMGFKSRGLPAIEVLRADGMSCHGFVAKATPAASSTPDSPRQPRPPASTGCTLQLSGPPSPQESVPDLASLRRLSAFRRRG